VAIETSLTIKQRNFCHEYINNGGKGIEAYMTAYDSKSPGSAKQEASKLLKRDDITEYIQALTKPTINKVMNERDKKRSIIWDRIQHCIDNGDDSAIARYMDILNKMDQEYINITRNEDNKTDISKLDTSTLLKLASNGSN
jgi:phage terminase small subunit